MRYLAKKTVFYIVALWAAITLNFALPRMMPGNPVEIMVAKFRGRISPTAIYAFRKAFGLQSHRSLPSQYVSYLGQLAHGNLGVSISMYPAKVTTVIAQAFPWTLFLIGLATIISFVVGTLIGIYAAWHRSGRMDAITTPFFIFTTSFPYFWFALLMIYLLAFKVGIFPLAHAYSGGAPHLSPSGIVNILYHAVLPAFTIVVASIGGWLLPMRNNMVVTAGEEYVRMGWAKGLADRRVMLQYAARNAILPNVTGFALSLGFVVSGALLTEIVFSYPGLGYTLFQAVTSDDYPLMQGVLLMIAVAVLTANFLSDLVYMKLDPRTRVG